MTAALRGKLALSRAVGSLSRRRGGGATSAPGRLLLRLQPDAIATLGARLPSGSALISATNGKTTSATMAAAILQRAGLTLVHNHAGANMAGGIATSLLDAAGAHDHIDGELGLFEVDELWLARIAQQLQPRVIALGNLFRDQLDRYGELERIADSWQAVADLCSASLVLNADDPLVADLGRGRNDVLYFGVEDDSLALSGMAHAADAKHCRRCGAPYTFNAVYLGHLGHYHCDSCGQSRPRPAVAARDVTLQGVHSSSFTLTTPAGSSRVELQLPGLYNVYNALAAASLALSLDVPFDSIVSGLALARAAFGRGERVSLSPAPASNGRPTAAAGTTATSPPGARELRILLIKNPAGANEILRTLALEPGEHDLLAILNDNVADGRDVSWIWDADFELIASRVRRVTCSGTRAADLALRFKYAGVHTDRIHLNSELPGALEQAAADRPDAGAPLYALPTYTAMLSLRELLVQRGEAPAAWS